MFETSEKKFKNFSPKIYYVAREHQLGFYVWSLNIRFHGWQQRDDKIDNTSWQGKRISWKAVGINSFPRWIIYIIPPGILLPPLQASFRALAWKKSLYDVFIFPCNFIYNGELRLIKKLYGTSGEEWRWMQMIKQTEMKKASEIVTKRRQSDGGIRQQMEVFL